MDQKLEYTIEQMDGTMDFMVALQAWSTANPIVAASNLSTVATALEALQVIIDAMEV